MKWEEVRWIYPNKYVKMIILETHTVENIEFIDDLALIKAYEDNDEAVKEHLRVKDNILIYHTGKGKIEIGISDSFRRRIGTLST